MIPLDIPTPEQVFKMMEKEVNEMDDDTRCYCCCSLPMNICRCLRGACKDDICSVYKKLFDGMNKQKI